MVFTSTCYRLIVRNVLSEPSSTWKGQKGRIDSRILSEAYGKDALKCSEKCTHFACICGPNEFTYTCFELLKKLGMKEGCVHAFMG